MSVSTACPCVRALQRMMLGQASVSECRSLQEHLRSCAECSQAAKIYSIQKTVMVELPKISGTPSSSGRSSLSAIRSRLQALARSNAATGPAARPDVEVASPCNLASTPIPPAPNVEVNKTPWIVKPPENRPPLVQPVAKGTAKNERASGSSWDIHGIKSMPGSRTQAKTGSGGEPLRLISPFLITLTVSVIFGWFGFTYGSFLWHYVNNEGELVVGGEDPSAQLVLKQNGNIVATATANQSLLLLNRKILPKHEQNGIANKSEHPKRNKADHQQNRNGLQQP